MDENLIKIIGCCDIYRMKKQCQKYDLTRVIEIDNKSEEQLETYEMTTEEEIKIKEFDKEQLEILLNDLQDIDKFTGFKDGAFKYELGKYQANLLVSCIKKYKEVIDKLKDKTKENIENAKCEITTLTIGDKAYYQYIEKILDNYVDILKEVE